MVPCCRGLLLKIHRDCISTTSHPTRCQQSSGIHIRPTRNPPCAVHRQRSSTLFDRNASVRRKFWFRNHDQKSFIASAIQRPCRIYSQDRKKFLESKSPMVALLLYNATPNHSGSSRGEWLMNRQLHIYHYPVRTVEKQGPIKKSCASRIMWKISIA